jgi:hypothetical protein
MPLEIHAPGRRSLVLPLIVAYTYIASTVSRGKASREQGPNDS